VTEDDLIRELGALPYETGLPAEFSEARIVARLRALTLLKREPFPWMRAVAAVVMVALLGASYFAGRAHAPPASAPTHILLVHNDANSVSDDGDARARKYGSWARELAGRGQLAGGARLTKGGWFVEKRGPRPADGKVAGYFLLIARSDAEALAIARACPHLDYDGRLELRTIR
jgi:hypothetical protein